VRTAWCLILNWVTNHHTTPMTWLRLWSVIHRIWPTRVIRIIRVTLIHAIHVTPSRASKASLQRLAYMINLMWQRYRSVIQVMWLKFRNVTRMTCMGRVTRPFSRFHPGLKTFQSRIYRTLITLWRLVMPLLGLVMFVTKILLNYRQIMMWEVDSYLLWHFPSLPSYWDTSCGAVILYGLSMTNDWQIIFLCWLSSLLFHGFYIWWKKLVLREKYIIPQNNLICKRLLHLSEYRYIDLNNLAPIRLLLETHHRIWWTWLYPPQHRLTELDQIWEILLTLPGYSIGLEIQLSAVPRLWNTFNRDLLNAKTLYNFKIRLRNYAIPKI